MSHQTQVVDSMDNKRVQTPMLLHQQLSQLAGDLMDRDAQVGEGLVA